MERDKAAYLVDLSKPILDTIEAISFNHRVAECYGMSFAIIGSWERSESFLNEKKNEKRT